MRRLSRSLLGLWASTHGDGRMPEKPLRFRSLAPTIQNRGAHMSKLIHLAAIALSLCAATHSSSAQSIGYADALGVLGKNCGRDIDKFCKKVNLGGGRMLQCLGQNEAAVSGGCKTSFVQMQTLLTTRAEARAAVLQV